jgi:hypothetical protein
MPRTVAKNILKGYVASKQAASSSPPQPISKADLQLENVRNRDAKEAQNWMILTYKPLLLASK